MDHTLCTAVQLYWNWNPQTDPTKLGAWNCPKRFGVVKHKELLSMEKGAELLKKKEKENIYPILQTLRLVNAVRQISLSSIGLPDGKVWFSTQLMLYIALGDIRLGCRYSAMETNSMKVLDTVLQLIWRSEVCSDWFCRTLVISAPADPTLWFYGASTLWLSFCDF